jgi:outer membrane protein
MRRLLLRAGSLFILPMMAGAALASDQGALLAPTPAADWTITIGAEGLVHPRWENGSNYVVGAHPLFDIRPAGTPARFHSPRDGMGFAVIETNGLSIGPVAKIRFPRREKDDANLAGLGNVDWAVELGGFVEYWPVQWMRLRSELRQGIGGHHGVVSDLAMDFVARATPSLTLSAGPRATFASASALQPYFGVSAAQALNSGLPVYDVKGGVHSVGAGTQARYQWSPQWATHVFAEYDRLRGDAANSPIVTQRGSAEKWTFGAGATYEFDMRKWW